MTTHSASEPADLVITGCTALRHDAQGEVYFTENTTLVVRDGLIASVTAAEPSGGAPGARPAPSRTGSATPGTDWGPEGAGSATPGAAPAPPPAAAPEPPPAAEHIGGRGLVALPGLINCHTHSPMVVLRGIAEDVPVQEWFNDWIWPVESRLTRATSPWARDSPAPR